MVSPTPLAALRLRVASLSDQNEVTLDSGFDRVLVRFDSEEKRNGTPIELKLKPVAHDLGFFPTLPHEHFYRFVLTTTDGVMPGHRFPHNEDYRYLGTFLDFTGGGY